jgi:hypothetical protein
MSSSVGWNKSLPIVLIAIIIGLGGLVISQYMLYSDRLSSFESQLALSNEQYAELETVSIARRCTDPILVCSRTPTDSGLH